MIALGVWVLVLGVAAAQAPGIHQQTQGPCSPVIGQTGGNVNVTINCPGVDPKALEALNRELGLTQGQLRLTNQQLERKTKEANEWARKYQELSQQAQMTQDKRLGRQAEALLRDGKLEEAKTLLKLPMITMAQYHAIQEGMSYPEVVKILGRPGEEMTRSPGVVGYVWQNADFSSVVVVFINDRVHTKGPSLGLR
jgi:hypothetical protein